MITQDILKRLFSYDEASGLFTRNVKRGRFRAGTVIGTINSDGYRVISIDGKQYHAGRLAFLYMTGGMPIEVDHADLVPSNDRWGNLREATRSQNNGNTRKRVTNNSGFKGVHFEARKQKYKAQIYEDGKHRHLGYFDSPVAAHDAYCEAAHRVFGAFARVT